MIIRPCTAISDPPKLTAEVLAQIDAESRRWGEAFRARTKSMEVLTSDDLRTRVR